MVTCRVIDNAGVALAAINRKPVATARAMALAHPRAEGATLFGLPPTVRVHAQWAGWANATAVRELDFHDCYSPAAHSLSYIVAVALEDGRFHHEHSYTPERAHRSTTIDLWHKVHSVIDPTWEALYRQARQDQPALGGRLELHLDDGRVIAGEKAVADAHTHGAHPMDRAGYREKFRTLASPVLEPSVFEGFLTLAHELPDASPEALGRLNPSLPAGKVQPDRPDGRGIFDHGLVASGGLQH